MNKDIIIKNEVENDGKTIHLYYNPEVGLYIAYGFSAFFVSHIVEVLTVFNEAMQMPVALVCKPEVGVLRLSCTVHEHEPNTYYRLGLWQELPLADYTRWANSLKNK